MHQALHLTPRMIQSMEILQMPLGDLEARIESELQSNPILELDSRSAKGAGKVHIERETGPAKEARSSEEHALVIKDNGDGVADFKRLDRLSNYLENEEFATNDSWHGGRAYSQNEDRDKKLDAMTNTAARGEDLNESLMNQWHLAECSQKVRTAGEAIINYIDQEGYLRTPLELIAREWKEPLDLADLNEALKKIQKMEPSGVGARSLQECLLIQLDALEEDFDAFDDHDFDLERTLIKDHLKDLEMNRYPQIAKKLNREISDIKAAVRGLARLNPRPGKDFAPNEAQPITPDATIYYDEETKKYEVKMSRESNPHMFISRLYRKWLKNREGDKQTREFLSKNLRNARWLMESIEQRAGTIQRVIKAVVEHQREFFDKGPEFLKPLPMLQVADQLGIHVATVSRAVSEKWVQTPQGVMPLRRFFSGGTTNAEGEDMSWDAVKEKLRQIVDNEDKNDPLNDDVIVEKLKEQGITLARRTVAKYRKILNIAPSRQRREFA